MKNVLLFVDAQADLWVNMICRFVGIGWPKGEPLGLYELKREISMENVLIGFADSPRAAEDLFASVNKVCAGRGKFRVMVVTGGVFSGAPHTGLNVIRKAKEAFGKRLSFLVVYSSETSLASEAVQEGASFIQKGADRSHTMLRAIIDAFFAPRAKA